MDVRSNTRLTHSSLLTSLSLPPQQWVRVPRVLWDYTSPQVLVMEYVPGIKINRKKELVKQGIDEKQIARLAVESYLIQILRHGFFHAGEAQAESGCMDCDVMYNVAWMLRWCSPYIVYIAIGDGCTTVTTAPHARLLPRHPRSTHPPPLPTADPHPGNVSVDPATGKLIYYDFGMMGQLRPGVREGLLKLFYGVYAKDADRCIDALVQMGVLIPNPGSDRTAVRRVGEFFLKSFETRLDEQRVQREEMGTEYGQEFKKPKSKEEAKMRRKQILEAIGEDLLSVAQDQPFRFPAEFTFVVRSFTVLDGIGKALDKKFDITEVSAPYARGLLLESRPLLKKWEEELKQRAALQNRAVVNLFRGPNMIEDVAGFAQRLERGDLKLRVRRATRVDAGRLGGVGWEQAHASYVLHMKGGRPRRPLDSLRQLAVTCGNVPIPVCHSCRALEAERALARVAVTQQATATAIMASMMVNVGTVLAVVPMTAASYAAFGAAAIFGALTAANMLKARNLERKEKQILGAA